MLLNASVLDGLPCVIYLPLHIYITVKNVNISCNVASLILGCLKGRLAMPSLKLNVNKVCRAGYASEWYAGAGPDDDIDPDARLQCAKYRKLQGGDHQPMLRSRWVGFCQYVSDWVPLSKFRQPKRKKQQAKEVRGKRLQLLRHRKDNLWHVAQAEHG